MFENHPLYVLPDDIEIIIMDDNSDPPLSLIPKMFPDCNIKNMWMYRSNDDRAWTVAPRRNEAARLSRAPYLLMTDIDHFWLKDAIMEAYNFTVPNGPYTLHLHFAETYDGITGDGQRVFSVAVNDQVVLEDFDPYKEGGGFQKPVVKVIKGFLVTSGKLAITFAANIQNPEINVIEILSE